MSRAVALPRFEGGNDGADRGILRDDRPGGDVRSDAQSSCSSFASWEPQDSSRS